jgi:hypothetical protein
MRKCHVTRADASRPEDKAMMGFADNLEGVPLQRRVILFHVQSKRKKNIIQ